MTPASKPSHAGPLRGCLPLAVAILIILAVVAIGTIFYARQIDIGPIDDEPLQELSFVTEYDAHIAKADRTDDSGAPLGDVLAILRRDRENYHTHHIRQQGDTDHARTPVDTFATDEMRAQLSSAELSIPDALRAQLPTRDTNVRVLVHRRAHDARLLVAVSASVDGAGKL